MQSKSMSSLSNLRDLFRADKDKIPPDLKRAMSLLKLTTLDELEQKFLGEWPFITPWAVYRDSCLLVNTGASLEPSTIAKSDILWFYTQFDENTRRHDLRLDARGQDPETSPLGFIDKSIWGPAEYEKHLYAWLLQSFQVGKRVNPWDFEYLELRSVCSAYENVFVPIVNAVRASYSPKGRRHYGRLATFIESKSPSRLAFPEGNVPALPGRVMSPTPFRMVSKPSLLRDASQGMLTKKHYDETERELRDVYPQYGGLVERPRFKQKMDDWLEEQRARAVKRKEVPGQGQQTTLTPSPPPHDQVSIPNPTINLIKRYSSSLRRSLSARISSSRSVKDIPESSSPSPQTPRSLRSKPSKSPEALRSARKQTSPGAASDVSARLMHQLLEEPVSPKTPTSARTPRTPKLFDDDIIPLPPQEPQHPELVHPAFRKDRFPSVGSIGDGKIVLPPPVQRNVAKHKHKVSEDSVYAAIRKSNPHTDVSPQVVVVPGHHRDASNDSTFSPMGALSAVPRPLFNDKVRAKEPFPEELKHLGKTAAERRPPSYEGTGYRHEIHPKDLQVGSSSMAKVLNADKIAGFKMDAPSRLPTPVRIQPIPYTGQLQAAGAETKGKDPVARPKYSLYPGHENPPRAVPWPGSEDPPPIPPKNPKRWNHSRGHVNVDRLKNEDNSVMRIVSKENIRAALGGTTPDASTEDLSAVSEVPSRKKSKPVLQTYNTHMFPRKERGNDTPQG